ncbi:MAG TPA: NEW3 domain-containing protein, partial [Anaeromyxobacter sp.]
MRSRAAASTGRRGRERSSRSARTRRAPAGSRAREGARRRISSRARTRSSRRSRPAPRTRASAPRPGHGSRAAKHAQEVRLRIAPADLPSLAAPIGLILADLRAARALVSPDSPDGANAAATLDEKIAAAESSLAIAAGVAVDALADTAAAAPGDSVGVTVQVADGGREGIEVESAALESPDGWTVAAPAAGKPVAAGAMAEWKLAATVPPAAPVTIPYFLRRPLAGAMYDWTDVPAAVRGEPYAPPALSAVVVLKVAGSRITIRREATFRYRDEAFGEIRRPVRAVAKAEVSVEPSLLVRPIGARGTEP